MNSRCAICKQCCQEHNTCYNINEYSLIRRVTIIPYRNWIPDNIQEEQSNIYQGGAIATMRHEISYWMPDNIQEVD